MPAMVTQGIRYLGRVSGREAVLYHCRKADGIIALESPLEKTVAQFADIDPRVISVKAQPFTVDVVSGHIHHTREELLQARQLRCVADVSIREYTPDFAFTMRNGHTAAIEVKDERFIGNKTYWKKIAQVRTILRQRSYEFYLVKLVYEEHWALIQNIELLCTYLSIGDASISTEKLNSLKDFSQDEISTLGNLCGHLNLTLRDAPALILSGVVSCDLSLSRLNINSPVGLGFGDLSHLEILQFANTDNL